jgi:hypothetical protein
MICEALECLFTPGDDLAAAARVNKIEQFTS